MILSRVKPALSSAEGGDTSASASSSAHQASRKMPNLEEFLGGRDYGGAMSLLEFNRGSGRGNDEVDMWIGYCAFHSGNNGKPLIFHFFKLTF